MAYLLAVEKERHAGQADALEHHPSGAAVVHHGAGTDVWRRDFCKVTPGSNDCGNQGHSRRRGVMSVTED